MFKKAVLLWNSASQFVESLEKWHLVGLALAAAFWFTSAMCYLAQDIQVWPVNQVDWILGYRANFYIGILMIGITFPFFWPKVTNKIAWVGMGLLQCLLMIYQLISYRTSLSTTYPGIWADMVLVVASTAITVLRQLRGPRH